MLAEETSSEVNILQLHGYRLDGFQYLSETITLATLRKPQILKSYLNIVQSIIDRSGVTEQSLARTLIAGTNHQTNQSTEADLQGFPNVIEYISTGRHVPFLSEIDEQADATT